MSNGPRVILVGHCLPDSFFLTSVIKKALPGAEVVRSNSDDDLQRQMATATVLLVNRVLDGAFSDETGVEMIQRLAGAKEPRPALMLVSNFPEAQSAAEAAGAFPGFGKSNCGSPQAAERLKAAANRA